jgi:uncharacterized protein (TIGR02594 family)
MCELPWIQLAESLLGTNEYPGSSNNPKIIAWAKELGTASNSVKWVANFYTKDEIPWCGLFVGYVMHKCDYDDQLPDNPLGALEWLNFGVKTKPRYGAVMCFRRNGGGHVGFYVSEDDEYYHILGGNQSDSVNVTKVAKDRFVGARWPEDDDTETQAIVKKFDGKVSTNEA